MLSRRIRFAAAVGVVVVFGAGAFTALALHSRSNASGLGVSANAAGGAGASTPIASAAITPQQNMITVVGTGTAVAVPDQAIVTLGVSATRPDVRAAVQAAADDMSRLIASLHSQGVQDKDIQTTSVWISQQNNCCPQAVTGYQSSNQLAVTIHHLVNVSPVIEAAVDAVGNEIQLGGVNLSVSNTSAQVKSARTAAMSDANARAQEWARLAGHHVGKLLGLSELVAVQSPFGCQCGGAGGGGGIPIQPGQTTVTLTITAVYELLD